MSLEKRWESEDALIGDVQVPRSKTTSDDAGQYEPFQDDGGPLEITKRPGKRRPAPTTVTAWSPKMSAPPGNVQGGTDTASKG